MGRQQVTPEQIIAKLREVDMVVGRWATAVEACRQVGISHADAVPVAQGVLGPEGRPGSANEGSGARERSAEEAGRGPRAGQGDPTGSIQAQF